MQALPLQQPFGHEVGSQTHWPVVVLHDCPDTHAAHAAPATPQDMFDSAAYGSHLPVEAQQPFGHETASHTHWPVPLHSVPARHALHMTPTAPHDAFDSLASGSHAPAPVQHPVHDEPPHEHAPPEQASPVPHAPQATPPVPHSVPDCDA